MHLKVRVCHSSFNSVTQIPFEAFCHGAGGLSGCEPIMTRQEGLPSQASANQTHRHSNQFRPMIGQITVRQFKRSGPHPSVGDSLKNPESKPQCSLPRGLRSVWIDPRRPGQAGDCVKKRSRERCLYLFLGQAAIVDEVDSYLNENWPLIVNGDPVFIQPTQDRTATLHSGAFEVECNPLGMAGKTANPFSFAFACKLPCTHWNMACQLKILRRSVSSKQQARQQRSRTVQLHGQLPKTDAGLMYHLDRLSSVKIVEDVPAISQIRDIR